jgi:hypothetical protein
MNNLKPFSPEDIDESLVKLVVFADKRFMLFPFIDATGAVPEFRSLGYPTEHNAIRVEDLTEMTSRMKRRAEGAVWHILFSTPWLVRHSDADAAQKRSPDAHRA